MKGQRTDKPDRSMFADRLQSFRHAFSGIGLLLGTQANARIHALATVLVVALGLALGLSAGDWCWLVVAIVMVWMAEALNTAFEYLCDVVAPEYNPRVKRAKDLAAAAVLVAATGSVIIGILVFGKYLLKLA
jgi:diacylglycerol kinase (ATP)